MAWDSPAGEQPGEQPVVVGTPEALDDGARAEVLSLAAAVEDRDGEPPLSDQALTLLGSRTVDHFTARDETRLLGYAQRNGDSVEIAGDPGALGPLLSRTLDGTARPIRVWSHGERSSLAPVLRAAGFRPVRTLHKMRRSLADPVPEAAVADGVVVRDFVPGQDEAAWLAVNAAAFATHPEQGRWTEADLAAREREPWFDPHGFLVAERAGRMIGFHWTKLHPDGSGEVYVLGLHPDAQGSGLGRTLLLLGLQRLAERGCPVVLLYVDDDNEGAISLYRRYGFAEADADMQWESPAPG